MPTYTDNFNSYSNNDSLETASSNVWKVSDPTSVYNIISCTDDSAGHSLGFAVRYDDTKAATAWYNTALAGDHYSQAVIAGVFGAGTNRARGVTVKDIGLTGASRSCYAAYIRHDGSNNVVSIAKVGSYASAPTVLVTSSAITYNTSGTTLKLTASGTSPVVLTAFIDGAQVATYSDSASPLSGTYCGVFAAIALNAFYGDSWEGGTSGASVTPVVMRWRM